LIFIASYVAFFGLVPREKAGGWRSWLHRNQWLSSVVLLVGLFGIFFATNPTQAIFRRELLSLLGVE
jgi:hypothetical protein